MSQEFSTTSQGTGIIVDSLNTSSLLYSISDLQPSAKKPLCLFYMNNGINNYNFNFSLFPILAIRHLKQYPSYKKPTIIATSLESAKLLINLRQPVNKKMYVYGLEWYNNKARTNYDMNIKILKNPELEVFTSHEVYKKAIEEYCGLETQICSLKDMIK